MYVDLHKVVVNGLYLRNSCEQQLPAIFQHPPQKTLLNDPHIRPVSAAALKIWQSLCRWGDKLYLDWVQTFPIFPLENTI